MQGAGRLAAWPARPCASAAGPGSRATTSRRPSPRSRPGPADLRDALLRSPAVRQRPPPAITPAATKAGSRAPSRARSAPPLPGPLPIAAQLREDRGRARARRRAGMGELAGGGERLAAPRRGLLGIAEGQERVDSQCSAPTRGVDGVDEAGVGSSRGVVEVIPASSGRGSRPTSRAGTRRCRGAMPQATCAVGVPCSSAERSSSRATSCTAASSARTQWTQPGPYRAGKSSGSSPSSRHSSQARA